MKARIAKLIPGSGPGNGLFLCDQKTSQESIRAVGSLTGWKGRAEERKGREPED